MNRPWKRWIALTLFVIVLGLTFLLLGRWQLDRLDQRQERNHAVLTNESALPRPYAEAWSATITDEDQWQRVTATGTFDGAHQFQVRYRYNNGQAGYEVVTPLHTAQGDSVLINRGFLPTDRPGQIPTTLPPPPAGEVTVLGHVRRNERGKPQAVDPVNHQIRLVNADAIGRTLPYPVLDGWIAALDVTPPQQAEFQPLALPEISDGPHFWYAMQWFLFALIGVSGLFVLIRGDLRDLRGLSARRPPSAPARAHRNDSPFADQISRRLLPKD